MVELVTMWRHTRMVTLTALCAAAFAAVLIPFKGFTIIPGITEVRPANALPILFSLLFGPAAAWGAAFGNTLGDFFGTLGIGTIFGFIGNLAYGYIPYRLWGILGGGEPAGRSIPMTERMRFVVATFTASLACGVFIAWPLDLTGLAPYEIVVPVITLNNFLVAVVFAPPLYYAVHKRARRLGLLYADVMDREDLRRPIAGRAGFGLLFCGLVTATAVGLLYRHGLAPDWASSPSLATAPFVVLAVIGLILI